MLHVRFGHGFDGPLQVGAVVGADGHGAIGPLSDIRGLEGVHGLHVTGMAPDASISPSGLGRSWGTYPNIASVGPVG